MRTRKTDTKSVIGTTARLAAERFLKELCPSLNILDPDRHEREIISCVESAFGLYDAEWDCHDLSILDWQWPATTLREGGEFSGNEPWSILFRAAVEMARRIGK